MAEKREKRNAIRWKNAVRLIIGIIAIALWIRVLIILIENYHLIASIFWSFGGIVLEILFIMLMLGAQNDHQDMQETENMEKAKQILSDSSYTPIRCTINFDGIQVGRRGIEALRSIASTQADVLKKFKLTLAAKLNEDTILYFIVDENGNEISKVDIYDTATFFMNNFERI